MGGKSNRSKIPSHIREHFINQRRSGLSIKAYCEKHSVSAFSFYAWRKRYGKAAPNGRPREALFRDMGLLATGGGVCDVRFPTGLVVSVRPGAGREELEQIFDVVGRLQRC